MKKVKSTKKIIKTIYISQMKVWKPLKRYNFLNNSIIESAHKQKNPTWKGYLNPNWEENQKLNIRNEKKNHANDIVWDVSSLFEQDKWHWLRCPFYV